MSSHSYDKLSLRRLSGPSYMPEPNTKSSTQWVWYWEDNDGWKKYAETLVSGSFICLDGRSHRGTRGGRLSCPQILPPLHTHTHTHTHTYTHTHIHTHTQKHSTYKQVEIKLRVLHVKYFVENRDVINDDRFFKFHLLFFWLFASFGYCCFFFSFLATQHWT